MTKARVAVVEDHPLLAEAIADLVARSVRMTVAAVVHTAADAARVLQAGGLDLLLLDQHLPDGRGTDIARMAASQRPRTPVVMLTGDDSDDTLLAAVEAGVSGFIPKREPAARIVALLERALDGEIVIPHADLQRLMVRQRERALERRERERVRAELTTRELEILSMMARGMDNHAICDEARLAVNTVRGHVQNVIEKMGTHSRLEAVLRARSLGLVEDAPPI